ncbi:OmpA family protein [Hyphomonas johnsonii]|uniref:OmpA-like domain-containing protein n=1 Tax=Hyphomonas johnsonii MHS-2 TaxID=1280950 RepID=A0A059FE99_9PROT|nr:OmpA family protein [Hyphomonas johnsonii]KCZ88922.1 hypothetical protein HJO_15434 [Hyphomonas johnsonii MHS-2]
MRLLDHLFALVALAGLILAGWWGVYQSPQNAVNLQSRLQQKTAAALTAAGMDWASVRLDGQTAILSGKAPSPDAVVDAANAVLTADGKGGLIFGGVTQVLSLADGAPPVSPYVWRATKQPDGVFILSGHVPSKAIRSALVAEAAIAADGAAVVDEMRLASGVPAGNWQGVARLGIRQLSRLDSGEVRLADTALRLRAVSTDEAVGARVASEISSIAAPFSGASLVRGETVWFARVGEDGLVLGGKVSSQSERGEILSIARAAYDGDVRDEMEVADQDYVGWMHGVRMALPHLARFRSGEMAFDPAGGGFSIDGLAGAAQLAYLQEDAANLSGPYTAKVFVEAIPVSVPEISGIDFTTDPLGACETGFATVLGTNRIIFEDTTARFRRESAPALDKLAVVAGKCDPALMFELGGHTDNQTNRSAAIALSEARAQAVADYLVGTGIDAGRMSAIGYGPDVPVRGNETREGRAANRRIEFKVLERSE